MLHTPAAAKGSCFAMSSHIGRFRIIKEIGRGGVGRVYHAHDEELGREVALKVLLSGIFADELEIKRFQREIESCARLRHPNIVSLYEVGKEEELGLYMVMELIKGISLEDYIHQHRISPHHAAQIISTLARAVHYAHQQGVVHRDIKPQNILIKHNSWPMLTDFGLAKQYGDERKRVTLAGEFLGTPANMPPEQINGAPPIPQMDIYALGTVFFEMLAGHPPYQGDELQVLYNILDDSQPVPSVRYWRPETPRPLDAICQKAMAKQYRQRYRTAGELAQDVENYLQGKPVNAQPVSLWQRGRLWGKRHPLWSLTLLLCLAGIIIGASCARLYQRHARLQNIEKILRQGDQIYQRLYRQSGDKLSLFRQARMIYEKALAEDRDYLPSQQKLYRLEIHYGKWALQNGYLERARDAYDNARAMAITTAELEALANALQQEEHRQDYLDIVADSSKSPRQRREALRHIARHIDKKAIRHLLAALDDPDPEMAKTAQAILLDLTPSQKQGYLLKAIPYLSESEARSLAKILAGNWSQIKAKVLARLDDQPFWIINNFLIILAVLKEKQAIAPLQKLAKNRRPSVQIAICKALGAIGAGEALPTILALLASSNQAVAITAAQALEKFGKQAENPQIIAVLTQMSADAANPLLRYHCWQALFNISRPLACTLAGKILVNPQTPALVYQKIWHYLARSSQSDFNYFFKSLPHFRRWQPSNLHLHRLATIPALHDRLAGIFASKLPPRLQQLALKICVELADSRAYQGIIGVLKSPYLEVRRQAAFMLCLRAEKIPEKVKDIIAQERDIYVRLYLSWAVVKKATAKDDLVWLLTLVQQKNLLFKILGLIGIGKCRALAPKFFSDALQSGQPLLAQYSAWAISRSDQKAKPLLVEITRAMARYAPATRYYLRLAMMKMTKK